MEVRVVSNKERELELEVRGESHTLGNLIAKELQSMEGVELAYYEIPHPLQDRMIIYVKTREGLSPLEALNRALSSIEETLNRLEGDLSKALGEGEG